MTEMSAAPAEDALPGPSGATEPPASSGAGQNLRAGAEAPDLVPAEPALPGETPASRPSPTAVEARRSEAVAEAVNGSCAFPSESSNGTTQ
jgi:hypothetical protein